MRYISENERETYNFGEQVGRLLKAGDIINLNGDLGAGKTQFTKGIARGLEIADYITSPSFTILNEYEGERILYHFDVYRIEDIDEMYEIGFDEFLYGDGVCVIEWGDKIKEILPEAYLDIRITDLGENRRSIEISGSDRFEKLQEMS